MQLVGLRLVLAATAILGALAFAAGVGYTG